MLIHTHMRREMKRPWHATIYFCEHCFFSKVGRQTHAPRGKSFGWSTRHTFSSVDRLKHVSILGGGLRKELRALWSLSDVRTTWRWPCVEKTNQIHKWQRDRRSRATAVSAVRFLRGQTSRLLCPPRTKVRGVISRSFLFEGHFGWLQKKGHTLRQGSNSPAINTRNVQCREDYFRSPARVGSSLVVPKRKNRRIFQATTNPRLVHVQFRQPFVPPEAGNAVLMYSCTLYMFVVSVPRPPYASYPPSQSDVALISI